MIGGIEVASYLEDVTEKKTGTICTADKDQNQKNHHRELIAPNHSEQAQ